MAQTAPKDGPAAHGSPDSQGQGHAHIGIVRKDERFSLVKFVRGFIQSSPWLVIAIAAHVVVFAVLAVWTLGHGGKPKEDTSIISTDFKQKPIEEAPEDETLPDIIDRTAIPENKEAELVSTEVADLLPDDSPRDLTQEIGDPTSNSDMPNSDPTGGTSVGVGTSGGHRGAGPSTFVGRRLGTGLKRGALPGGPTQGTEEAIRIGLIWLVRHQNDDGSWSALTCKDHCPPDKPCMPEAGVAPLVYTDKLDVGLTGLSLLAFLGAGYGHNAKQYVVDTFKAKKSELGKDVVLKGLKWLVTHQNPDGSFTSPNERFLYNDALAALALSEAYGLTQNRAWKEPAQKAINFLYAAQRDNPSGTGKWGWRYLTPQDIQDHRSDYAKEEDFKAELRDSDTSVTGWCVMALKSAQVSGLEVPQEAIEGALTFTKWVSAKEGGSTGLVGYLNPNAAGLPIQGDHDLEFKYHAPSMAAVAMCVRVFLEQNIDDPFLKLSADQIIKSLPSVDNDPKEKTKSLVDYYYWYYSSLALNQLDGPDAPKRTNKYWGPWNKAMQDSILSLQSKEEKQCMTGGFLKPDRWSFGIGPIYTTAINVLTLEVYYRYENAFGAAANKKMMRKTGAKEKPSASSPAANPPANENK